MAHAGGRSMLTGAAALWGARMRLFWCVFCALLIAGGAIALTVAPLYVAYAVVAWTPFGEVQHIECKTRRRPVDPELLRDVAARVGSGRTASIERWLKEVSNNCGS